MTPKKTDFRKCILTVHSSLSPDLRLSPKAKSLINRTMNRFQERIVDALKQNYSKHKRMTILIAEKALEPIICQLSNDAFLAGMEAVDRYKNGEIRFTVPSQKRKIPSYQRIESEEKRSFMKGFSKILLEYDETIHMDADGKTFCSEKLRNLTTALMSRACAGQERQGAVTPVDIKMSVDDVIGGELARFANAEALKRVAICNARNNNFELSTTSIRAKKEVTEVPRTNLSFVPRIENSSIPQEGSMIAADAGVFEFRCPASSVKIEEIVNEVRQCPACSSSSLSLPPIFQESTVSQDAPIVVTQAEDDANKDSGLGSLEEQKTPRNKSVRFSSFIEPSFVSSQESTQTKTPLLPQEDVAPLVVDFGASTSDESNDIEQEMMGAVGQMMERALLDANAVLQPEARRMIYRYWLGIASDIANNIPDGPEAVSVKDLQKSLLTVFGIPEGKH